MVPSMPSTSPNDTSPAMTPEQRKAIAVQIGDAKPATDALIGSFAESVANVRNHEHPSWEDLYCINLTSYMGERMAPVLRRLLDAETEVDRLRAQVVELEAQRDRRRERLVALQNDALNMRGSLSPNGEARKVPFELGETLTPAVDWLINRVAELESQLRPSIEAERNEIRQSYSALAAQAEQDRDHEGAADVELQLRDREEQWRREDAAPSPRDLRPGAEAARRAIRNRQEATS